MLFQDCVDVELLCPEDGLGGYAHVRMGEPYASLTVREAAADS